MTKVFFSKEMPIDDWPAVEYVNQVILGTEMYRLSDCLEQPNTWPTSLNYSTIVSCCSLLYFDVLLCSTPDCSALKCIAHKHAHIVQHNI